jgi:hypothetical protein
MYGRFIFMASELNDQEQIRRYLLREVSDQEGAQVEMRIMVEEGYAEEVSMLEDELVDEYLGGGLTSGQRARFEASYLATPEGREHMNFAVAFQRHVSAMNTGNKVPNERDSKSGLFRSGWFAAQRPTSLALAVLVLLLLVLSSWLLLRVRRADRELDRVKSELASTREQSLSTAQQRAAERDGRLRSEEETRHQKASFEAEIASLKRQGTSAPGGAESIALVLSAGQQRGGGQIKPLTVQPGANTVRIRLILPESIHYHIYRATLRPNGGQEIVLPDGLPATRRGSGKSVIAGLPVQSLDSGDYSLTLYGGQPDDKSTYVATYGFRLIKR